MATSMVDAVVRLRSEETMETFPNTGKWLSVSKVTVRYVNVGRGWNWDSVYVTGRDSDAIRQRHQGYPNPAWLDRIIRDNMPKGK